VAAPGAALAIVPADDLVAKPLPAGAPCLAPAGALRDGTPGLSAAPASARGVPGDRAASNLLEVKPSDLDGAPVATPSRRAGMIPNLVTGARWSTRGLIRGCQ
jgi:hypothetical protein